MAKSALPLLLGAAAAFLVLSKRGGGTETVPNIILLEKEEDFNLTDAKIAEFESKYDSGCAIVAFVPGLSSDQLATAAVGIAKENPRTLFFVFSVASVATLKGTSGPIGVSVARVDQDGVEGAHKFLNVTPEMIPEKVPAAYNLAIQDLDEKASQGSGGGTGQRGRTGSTESTANATLHGSRGLASRVSTRDVSSTGWFRRLRGATNI